jgi:HJR/Mrr/RecB family endonuclease
LPTPNLFLIYLAHVEVTTAFYRDLFEMEPDILTPRYVPFTVAPGVLFARWSEAKAASQATTRTSEVGLMVPGSAEAVESVYDEWMAKIITVVEEMHEDFGRTFVDANPDGYLIRVSPVD